MVVPAERAVIDPADNHVGRHLRRQVRQHRFRLSFDEDFASAESAFPGNERRQARAQNRNGRKGRRHSSDSRVFNLGR